MQLSSSNSFIKLCFVLQTLRVTCELVLVSAVRLVLRVRPHPLSEGKGLVNFAS